jgi:hypothetical protein
MQEGEEISTIFITRKEEDDLKLARELRRNGIITTPGEPFEASAREELDALIARGVFEFVAYDPKVHKGRIFKSRIVNEVKGKSSDSPREKSRCVVQAYNDAGKETILTQSPTIQRASQRLILSLAPALRKLGMKLVSRDITQAYVQSTSFLNRQILCQIPREFESEFPKGTIMIVRKPLYGIPEAGTHWWATYNKHHREELNMESSTYDPCLLISTGEDGAFAIVGMQTDDTLILADEKFLKKEEQKLKEANLTGKPIDELTEQEPLPFNGGVLYLKGEEIHLQQKGQGKKIVLVDPTSKDRTALYRQNRARGHWLATTCQPEASCALSIAAQYQEPTDEEIKELNKRLQWQLDNIDRGIKYVPVDLSTMKMFVFVDGSFANNKDLSSQIGYEIILANEVIEDKAFTIRGNLVHYTSGKSKRVTRSVLASEIYGMVGGTDMALALSSTMRLICKQLGIPLPPVIVCTDSFSLYECLVKLGTTKEKRLMIDIMALRQSYERRELTEVRWINGEDNPADAMTKINANKTLERFLDDNEITVRMEGWVDRTK